MNAPEVRAWIGTREVNGGLEEKSAAIENSRCDKPGKYRPDVGQVPYVPLVAGRTRRIVHCVAVSGQADD